MNITQSRSLPISQIRLCEAFLYSASEGLYFRADLLSFASDRAPVRHRSFGFRADNPRPNRRYTYQRCALRPRWTPQICFRLSDARIQCGYKNHGKLKLLPSIFGKRDRRLALPAKGLIGFKYFN